MSKAVVKEKKKLSSRLPHVYILLMIVMLAVVVLSKIIPSGEFAQIADPNTGRMVIDPNNFKLIPQENAITFMSFFTAIHTGIVQSGDVIFNILIISGVIYMLEQSGAIAAGIHKVLEISKGKEMVVVAVLTFVFTVLGAIGFGEMGLPFIPLAMTVVMALGYDRMAGVGAAMLGTGVGFASGVLNIYTTGISQSILGLPMFSGMGFRMCAFVIFYIITVCFIMHYCKKIKKDPSKSIVAKEYMNQDIKEVAGDKVEMNNKRGIALLALGLLFVLQAYGSSKFQWGMPNFSAIYLMYAIFLAILFRQSTNEACTTFAIGASKLIPAALTIGLARSVMVLMSDAKIIDTAINNVAQMLDGKGAVFSLLIVYLIVTIFNFFVVSGSGKALIMMPILGPLGQLLKINQQVMVLCFQFGDGFTNYIWPTSGALLAGLSMCKVEWGDWIKFTWKLFAFLSVLAFGMVLFANYINLGPF